MSWILVGLSPSGHQAVWQYNCHIRAQCSQWPEKRGLEWRTPAVMTPAGNQNGPASSMPSLTSGMQRREILSVPQSKTGPATGEHEYTVLLS